MRYKIKRLSQVQALPVCIIFGIYILPLTAEADQTKELLNRESRAAHKSLIEPTPKSTLAAMETYSPSQQRTLTSPTTSRLKTKRSKTSVEKPKAKKPLKTYGKGSQDIFEFHGGSEGELDITPRTEKAGKRKRNENLTIGKAASMEAVQDENVTRKPIGSSGGDTELLSIEPKPNETSLAGEKDVSLQSSMPPPASKSTSFEQWQRSETNTMPAIADPTPPKFATSNEDPAAEATCFEPQSDGRMPTTTRFPHSDIDVEHSRDLSQSVNFYAVRSSEGTNLQPPEEPAPTSSASEISLTKTKRTNQTRHASQELSSNLGGEYLRSQLDSNMSTTVNPVVLLPAPTDTEGLDELSLSIPETASKSPSKPAKASKRKRSMDDEPVDEIGSDDNAVGVPKEHYQPRPSKRRSGGGHEGIVVPTDFSKRPEAMLKGKRKAKRHKTTAFQELLPKDEDEDEEIKVVPDPRFDIPEKTPSKTFAERDQPNLVRNDDTEEIRPEAQLEPKQAAKAIGQKKRGRPKKVVTNLSEETVVDEAEDDHDQDDAETEDPVISATAKKSRKKTKTKETATPIIDGQDHNNDGAPATEDDLEDPPAHVLHETHGNIAPSKLTAKPLPETSSVKANATPETPRRSTMPEPKGPDKHSPISSGKVAYRVGLSKRARIAPLLRIVRK